MMMREIKFRGKCTPEFPHPTVKWVYGSLVSDSKKKEKTALICVHLPVPTRDGNIFWYEVDADTVGQCTGLLDSNGKEIYEGDIVRFELPPMVLTNEKTAVGVVVYEYGQFLVIIHAMRFTIFSIINDCTVIGNVCDDPELMEK